MTLQIFTEDSRAETIENVISAVKEWRADNVIPPALSAGTDRKDGSWVLEEDELEGLMFQAQLMAEESYRLRLTAIQEQRVEAPAEDGAGDAAGNGAGTEEATGAPEMIEVETEIDAGTVTVEVPEDLGPTPLDLRAVLNDPGLAASLSAAGLETIRARHTCAHRVDELMAICDELDVPAQLAAA